MECLALTWSLSRSVFHLQARALSKQTVHLPHDPRPPKIKIVSLVPFPVFACWAGYSCPCLHTPDILSSMGDCQPLSLLDARKLAEALPAMTTRMDTALRRRKPAPYCTLTARRAQNSALRILSPATVLDIVVKMHNCGGGYPTVSKIVADTQ
ncbi:hypothetical protein CC80DRAFT_545888 [Byssothecium circinans]|uniref:Uncharacterized protein n=1 Tax=Byssothecium circinans TaxID=147558 RepID=A0A6A5U3L6_9PLEO|nr:hypothetical protein CC80DRAFT_545888 [Byssothecium circinans]